MTEYQISNFSLNKFSFTKFEGKELKGSVNGMQGIQDGMHTNRLNFASASLMKSINMLWVSEQLQNSTCQYLYRCPVINMFDHSWQIKLRLFAYLAIENGAPSFFEHWRALFLADLVTLGPVKLPRRPRKIECPHEISRIFKLQQKTSSWSHEDKISLRVQDLFFSVWGMSSLAQSRRWYLAPRPLQVLPRFINNSSATCCYISPLESWKVFQMCLRGRVLELPNQSLRSNRLPFAFIVIILQAPSLGTHH